MTVHRLEATKRQGTHSPHRPLQHQDGCFHQSSWRNDITAADRASDITIERVLEDREREWEIIRRLLHGTECAHKALSGATVLLYVYTCWCDGQPLVVGASDPMQRFSTDRITSVTDNAILLYTHLALYTSATVHTVFRLLSGI